MALQNRGQPDGTILALSERGRFMGNRGILHDSEQNLSHRRWRHKAWVTCLLSFKGRKRPVMAPDAYTELFFLDEAVAFAAGHRPCGECRRDHYNRFRDAAGLTGRIGDFDNVLHKARAEPRTFRQIRFRADISTLPDGVFVQNDDGSLYLVYQDALFPYADMAYREPIKKPKTGTVTVLTPAPLIDVLRSGYRLDIGPLP